MKTISHSEACAFWDCPKKWDLIYNKKIKHYSPFLEFGTMAHKVLETREIPDEILYPNLKETFNITSWTAYFTNIFNLLDNFLKDYEILDRELRLTQTNVVGVIDLVCKKDNTIYLFDYKFTENEKTYDDIYLDEQLKIYAYLYSLEKWCSIDNIKVGYLSIPKLQVSSPQILKNGSLSKSKAQATTYELYTQAINDLGLAEEDYSEILEYFKTNRYIKTIISSVDTDKCWSVIDNLQNTIYNIENYKPMVCNSASKCKNCEYLKECKF